HPDLANAAGDDAVAELQPQAARGDDVVLDDAAAPGAARDREADGRDALAIEPSAPDAVRRVAENADAIDGVLRRDDDAVSRTQFGLLHRTGNAALLENRVDGSGADDHGYRSLRSPLVSRPGKIVSASMAPCDSA